LQEVYLKSVSYQIGKRKVEVGKDLEIKSMNSVIGKLEPTNILYKNMFDKLKSFDDIFDEVVEKYPNRILDMFPSQLEEDSEEIGLLDSQYFKLVNEEKYLNFLVEVFEKNDSVCYVEVSAFTQYNDEFLLRLLNELDRIDKYILLEQRDIILSLSETKYVVKDKHLLKTLFKCLLRELMPIEFYFIERPLIIFNNFDMSLPLVFKEGKDVKYYKNMAEKHSLFLR
jgi:hypothetical protein